MDKDKIKKPRGKPFLTSNRKNLFESSKSDQEKMITFNKDNAQRFLEKIRATHDAGETEFIFEDNNDNNKIKQKFKLPFAKEALRSLILKKLINKEDANGLGIIEK